jgi:cation diffusion facilitator family transporter
MEAYDMHQGDAKQSQVLADRVSVSSIVGNLALSLFKLAAGILGHSSALISDAVHSASDIVSTVIVMIGMRVSAKAPDREHEYGHERLECIAALLLAVLLAATGLGIGYQGVMSILHASYRSVVMPGRLPLVAAAISILVKEIMFRYTRWAARRINSTSLMADAWHHRSDALSSVGSLLGVLGARLGYPICDPIASLIICLFIIKAAFDIFMDAVQKVTDTSGAPAVEEQMRQATLSVDGVARLDSLRTRQFGSKLYVDVEVSADGTLTLSQGHAIAEAVHDRLEHDFPEVKHCMVHMNPL